MATPLSSPQWFTAAVTKSSASSRDSIYYLNKKLMSDDSSYYSNRPTSKLMSDDSSCYSNRRGSLCTMVDAPKKEKKIKKKNLKPVKFDDSEQSCVVHQLEASDVDPQQLWFSKQEIKAIRKEGRKVLDKVNKSGGDLKSLDEGVGESIRGLEHGLSVNDFDKGWNGAFAEDTEASPMDRSERRRNIVSTILAQQQEQHDAGINDPKGLQVTSKACTQWARDRALDQAEKDFEDALEVWREDAACSDLLPTILNKKSRRASTRRTSIMTMKSDTEMSAAKRKATLDTISRTVASALEELEDLDF